MKNATFRIILLCMLCCPYCSFSQTIKLYTPNGSEVEAVVRDEMSQDMITYYTAMYQNTYPKAEVLTDASCTYNCHAYAWYLTKGGTTRCWIYSYPDLHKYWDDMSYVETTEADAEVIYFYNGDHSAVKSPTTPGKYESKWGMGPVMRHDPGYGPPDYDMKNCKYYKRPSTLHTISGPAIICNSGVFELSNISTDNNVSWASSSNLTCSSVTTSGAEFDANGSGSGWVQATVDGVMAPRYAVWVGTPTKPISIEGVKDGEILGVNKFMDCILTAGKNQGVTQYKWDALGASVWDGQGTPEIMMRTETSDHPFTLSAALANECGWGPSLSVTGFVATSGSKPFLLLPNPASDEVKVYLDLVYADLSGNTSNTSPQSDFQVKILNSAGLTVYTKRSTEPIFNMSVSSLPNGVYVVIVSDGTAEVYSKLLVDHSRK